MSITITLSFNSRRPSKTASALRYLEKGAVHLEHHTGILSPGLINAHCHLELSHLKGAINEGTGLPGFVGQVMRLRHFDREEILTAIKAAAEAMWQSGIQAVGDICNTTDTLIAKQDSKIRYRNFIECLGFLPEQAKARFDYARDKVWAAFYDQNRASTLVPHAPYSVSAALFYKISKALDALPAPARILSIHNQESAPENEFFQHGSGAFIDFYKKLGSDISYFKHSGQTSLQTVLPEMATAGKILLVHNTFTSSKDLVFAKAQAARLHQTIYLVLCPGANLYIENRLPDLDLFLEAGLPVALGTDSLASNHQLSIVREMQHIRAAYPSLPKEKLLYWATYSGAEALGMEEDLGHISKGKRPGIVLLSEDLTQIRRII